MPTYQSLCEQYELNDELSTMSLIDELYYLFTKDISADDAFIILSEHHSALDIFIATSVVKQGI
jgi:hypothetical protein